MRVKNLKEAKQKAKANAKLTGSPRYIAIDTAGNIRVEKDRPKPQWENMYWEALPDGTLRQVINLKMLRDMSIINSRYMPTTVNHNGTRKQWVGIGWVDEGPESLEGDEVWVHEEE